MKCPRCRTDLEIQHTGPRNAVEVEICPDNHGMWLDKGELDHLDESVWGNAEEDIEYVEVKSPSAAVDCPKCATRMALLSPVDKRDLVIDYCPSCAGVWLDNGEIDGIREALDAQIGEPVLAFKPLTKNEKIRINHLIRRGYLSGPYLEFPGSKNIIRF